ncbi:LysR family transcriptional regulator [Streptomyces sp. MUSC 14]|uniref:LysR family transcriptional regulator n=1 Tax=Streptomyces sp. MUSC 14 TaxID=1354889 RepID=UPI0008F5BE4C|nr:LysR family transcriptional regulator [Streptomyces sp. MUSC 14]OIJ90341.1 LysR family transcriptional regulator [Streptomyces sp. MUSC 14]
MELELRHLRLLRAVAEVGSISRAAAVLGYSQQSVSAQLQRIERHFGQPVFARGSSGVEPTSFGVDVLSQARDVLARMEVLGRHCPKDAVPLPSALRLAATNTPILPGMVARLQTRLPGVAIKVSSVYSSSEIVELLERDELDIALGVDYPGMELQHSDAVAHRGIVTEPTFVALPTGHRLGHRSEIVLGDLADEAWFLTPNDGAGWPEVFYTACHTAGFTPATVHEYLGDRRQLQEMIANGLGVSMVQATTRPSPGVLVKPLAGTPLWCRYLLAWRPESLSEQLVDLILSVASAAYGDLIASSPHAQAWVSRVYRPSRS